METLKLFSIQSHNPTGTTICHLKLQNTDMYHVPSAENLIDITLGNGTDNFTDLKQYSATLAQNINFTIPHGMTLQLEDTFSSLSFFEYEYFIYQTNYKRFVCARARLSDLIRSD